MAGTSVDLRAHLPAASAAVSILAVFVAVLSVPLAVTTQLGLSGAQSGSWLLGLYGLSGMLTLVMVARHRQPLLLTGNVFVLIFVARLGTTISWPELVGAAMVAGGVVLLLGPLGLTARLGRLLPPAVVFGLLAGAVLPFVVDMFTALGDTTRVVGLALLAYLVARRLVEPRVPAILVALVAAGLAAIGTGSPDGGATSMTLPTLTATRPAFGLRAIASATPVMVALITMQANLPSLVFLRSQGYDPPERSLNLVSGVGTIVGSLLGPVAISLSLPATALCAGPDAGPRDRRHHAAAAAGLGAIAIAIVAVVVPDAAQAVPEPVLDALVGLAVLGVLGTSLRRATEGPLVLGPLFAFAIALSDLQLLGLGAFFWALVVGVAVAHLVEAPSAPGGTSIPATSSRPVGESTPAPARRSESMPRDGG